MKEEKIRVIITDGNNNMITFERFACSLKTAEKNMDILLSSPLYRIGLNNASHILFYSVINGNKTDMLKEKSL